MNFGPFPVLLRRILERRWTCCKAGASGSLPRRLLVPPPDPAAYTVAALRTWRSRPPPTPPCHGASAVAPTSAAAGAGAASLPLRPYPQARAPARKVRGPDPATTRGASGSHTHIELRPGGRLEERGMRVRPRVRLRCRAAAGGESESARGSGNASVDAHGLAVRAGMKPCRGTRAHGRSAVLHMRMHIGVLRVLMTHRRCHGRRQHGATATARAPNARGTTRSRGQHQRLPRLHLCLRLGRHRRHVRRRRGCGAYGERMRDACAALGGGGGRWAYGVGRRPRRVGIRRITGVRRRQGGREWRLGWGRVPRVHRAERRAEAGEGGRSALIGRER
ncbi:hypothetical protein B0H14DRAFT_3136018 [Mycena olivaceomarginata]|nr:hypothetical protein B0H14DRAFT_3136018 [Mycena olivaceomarginata]